MSWLMGVGSGIQAVSTLRSGRQNAGLLEQQARVATNQATRDEEAERSAGRQQIGSLAASMAQAGGGGDAGILRQSTIANELDALNTRYAGSMRAAGLLSEARNTRQQSKLLAGAQLLSGGSQAYLTHKIYGV